MRKRGAPLPHPLAPRPSSSGSTSRLDLVVHKQCARILAVSGRRACARPAGGLWGGSRAVAGPWVCSRSRGPHPLNPLCPPRSPSLEEGAGLASWMGRSERQPQPCPNVHSWAGGGLASGGAWGWGRPGSLTQCPQVSLPTFSSPYLLAALKDDPIIFSAHL